MDPARIALSLTGVSKTFPGVVALRDVSFEVEAGEIHALVGGNGAGKSTLMGIAAGSTSPDSGRVEIGGEVMLSASPVRARQLGLAIVRQNPALLPDLSVAENMWLGVRPQLRGGIGAAGEWARRQLQPWGIPIDPGTRIVDLSLHRQFIVEIAKAIAIEPSILVLDEPTEHLTAPEIDQLFERVRAVRERGGSVVYISHRIPEVKRIADRITVLRDGETRGTYENAAVSEDDIVRLIVGRAVETVFPPKRADAAEAEETAPLMIVDELSGDGFSGVSMSLQPGEIVGLAGVEGNGQREFLRSLAGLEPARGSVLLADRSLKLNDPTAMRNAGVSYLPQDRQAEALLLNMPVRDNMSLGSLAIFARLGVVQRRAEAHAVAGQIGSLDIKTPSQETEIRALSGGNQQKVMLARNALGEPRVLLAEEPTQGVDAGARVEIYRILRGSADGGAGVVVLSSDEIELEGLCDRVLIFSRGRVVRELVGPAVTEHKIQEAALRATQLRERQDAAMERTGRTRLRDFVRGDYGPSVILALAIVLLGIYATWVNPSYLTERNFGGVLQLLAALTFVSVGQLIVMLTGGIDLSVGALTGFIAVVASFIIVDQPDRVIGLAGTAGLVAGLVLIIGIALGTGLLNGLLVRKALITPVVATLAVSIAVGGLALWLRPTPGGLIQSGVTELVRTRVGFIPIAVILAIGLVLLLEFLLRRRAWGLELRASGSSAEVAGRLGIPVNRRVIGAYMLCSLIMVLAAFMLMGQIGVGDASSGVSYTLASIGAVVLGGASIFGGRGSFIGALLGAATLQQATTVTSFLRLDSSATFLLLGLLTLGAAAIYSTARHTRVRA
ncbi:MAG TPA: ATP-binding cassette domain-containing protein [Candidatus Limnocylindria bacterium]|nr:ATP-binding cassette domain-containing protein [Candidatus Limnocylindria bacterium]